MSAQSEPVDDTRLCYEQALAALRLAGVVAGRLNPREDEPIDIVILAAMKGRNDERKMAPSCGI